MLIERLTGTYSETLASGLILDVNGVGYGVETPLSTLCSLPPIGSRVSLWIHTYVREDAMRLFGFLHQEDRIAFDVMLGLSGVGPKVALAILSTLQVSAIREAIQAGRPQILESVPGVGKRLAEKILLELKPKLVKLQSFGASGLNSAHSLSRLDAKDADPLGLDRGLIEGDSRAEAIFEDVHSALQNLGFKDKVTRPLVTKLRNQYDGGQLQDVMREALKLLSEGSSEKSLSRTSKVEPPAISNDRELF